jgi:hypothetical protein
VSKHPKGDGGQGDSGDAWSAVSEAAVALERELRKFEQAAATARRLPMDTRKGLERAAVAATEAAKGQEHVASTLGALVHAIQVARERHEANVTALAARGEEIQRRAEVITPLHERYAALGEVSRAINELVQKAAVMQKEATTAGQVGELVAFIEGIEEGMTKLIEGARNLGKEAGEASATDVAQQADALRQQAAAARNKLVLLRKSLAELVPDRSKLN